MTSKRNRDSVDSTVDGEISEVATEQRGLVSLHQIELAGLGPRGTSHRAAKKKLHRVHRGVYAVGHRSIGRAGLLRAAVLACGEGAVISHATAATLWGLRDEWPVVIDVIVPCEQGRKLDGIRAHRCRYPAAAEIAEVGGIPCTTPARTLVDMAGTFGTYSLRLAVEQAAVRKLLDLDELDRAMRRGRGRRGVPVLRAIADEWRAPDGQAPDVRSVFEARILPRLLALGFERPACNRTLQIDGHRLTPDFFWERQRLIVETDGAETHATPPAFRRDRWRDQVLMANGYRATRVAWEHIQNEPDETVGRIRRMLEQPVPGSAEDRG